MERFSYPMFANCVHAQSDVGGKCSRLGEIRSREVGEVAEINEIAGFAEIGQIAKIAKISEIPDIAG